MGNLATPREQSLSSPGHDQVLDALRRILDSNDFLASDRNKRFLSYVVLETLAGRADRLKGYTVAVQVFGRDAAFDAQTHPLVRVEAGRLRQSLERYYLKSGKADDVRITIPKGGYVPIFERVAAADAPQQPTIEPRAALEITEPDVPRAPARRALGVVGISLAALFVAGGLYYADMRYTDTPPAARAQAAGIGPSVLVKPFSSIDGNAAEEQFSHGLSQELGAALARFKTIQVVPARTGDSALSGAAEHGRHRYDYIVKGSIRKIDDAVRIVALLEDGQSGALLWTRIFDGPAPRSGLLDAQSDIAGKIATALGDPYDVLFSNEARRVRAVPVNDDAYACVLRFNAYWANPKASEHLAMRDCHERAVGKVPHYADAWIDLAWLYVDEYRFGFNPAEGKRPPLERAADAALRAEALQPDSARAHLAMAVVQWFRHDPRGFDQHADMALALNANDPAVAGELGLRFVLRGEWERGRPLIDRVVARDPQRWQIYRTAYAMHAMESGDYTTALDELDRTKVADRPIMRVMRAAIYGQLGYSDKAGEEWRAAARDVPRIVDEPRAWLTARGVSTAFACQILHGLDKAGLLRTD